MSKPEHVKQLCEVFQCVLTFGRFCIDINSPRTLQTATEKLFQAVSQYAEDVPIVVVATKKDDFLDIQFSAHRKAPHSHRTRTAIFAQLATKLSADPAVLGYIATLTPERSLSSALMPDVERLSVYEVI